RRMAALRAGFAERASWPRADPRPDLQARRHAGGLRGAGRLGAPAQVIAFSSEVGTGSREENASKQESRASALRGPVSQRELRDVPAGVPAHRPRDRDDEHAADREQDGPPKHLEAGCEEDHLAPGAVDVAAIPA